MMWVKKIDREILGVATSFLLWCIVFNTQYFGSFWIRITVATIILALYVRLISVNSISGEKWRIDLKVACTGIISGLILYLFFFLGFNLLKNLVYEGAITVYVFKYDQFFQLAPILLLITSFCEEYFWRGYVQNKLSLDVDSKFNSLIITSTLYSLIHISTLNISLMIAAFLAGLFWGIIYLKTNSLYAVIISHMVWTELIFIYLPLA